MNHTSADDQQGATAILYGLDTIALMKRQEAELEVAEFLMLRFLLGVTRMDNQSISEGYEKFGDKRETVEMF